MNKGTIKALIILVPVIMFYGCCIENPVDDGVSPRAGVSIIYQQDDGEEVVESYDSDMPQPAALTGFEVFIPTGVPYTLVLTGQDGGAVSAMELTSVEFANTSDMPVIKPEYTIASRDLTSCFKRDRLFRHEVEPHDAKRIYYHLTVIDNSQSQSGVGVIVVP